VYNKKLKKEDNMIKVRDLGDFILLLIFIYIGGGLTALLNFSNDLATIILELLKIINIVSMSYNGVHVLVLLFSTTVTFLLVGIILEEINSPRGRTGSYFGKLLFWLIGIPVSLILNTIILILINL
jgi:hypothetical protein